MNPEKSTGPSGVIPIAVLKKESNVRVKIKIFKFNDLQIYYNYVFNPIITNIPPIIPVIIVPMIHSGRCSTILSLKFSTVVL
jgi:hypothetical protein